MLLPLPASSFLRTETRNCSSLRRSQLRVSVLPLLSATITGVTFGFVAAVVEIKFVRQVFGIKIVVEAEKFEVVLMVASFVRAV